KGYSRGYGTDFKDLSSKTLLTPSEVALFLSVSLKTIYRWYHSGVIDGTKVNRSLRIYRESVLTMIDERRLKTLD
ncbi:MAG: helix-turn-helix domain-containing protein, partial [Syntrophorhabdales bacterium]